MALLALLDQIRAYGPIDVKPGKMLVSVNVPYELQKALAEKFWDAKAVLEEWNLPNHKAVTVAEAILKDTLHQNSLLHQKPRRRKPQAARKRTTPKKRGTSAQS